MKNMYQILHITPQNIASNDTSHMKLKKKRKNSRKSSNTTSFQSHQRNFISITHNLPRRSIISSSSAAFRFAVTTASPQHSRKGGKTCPNTLSSLCHLTWRQVLPAPVKRNWSHAARVACQLGDLLLRAHVPYPHGLVARACEEEEGGTSTAAKYNRNTVQQNKITQQPKTS